MQSLLIVEDSSFMCRVIHDIITSFGTHQVVGMVHNGEEALDYIATNTPPDIIILDIEMPEIDGLEFLRRARAQFGGKIIVITASGETSSEVTQAKSLGADKVVYKPDSSDQSNLPENWNKRISEALAP